jgi:putative ABC transport system substrate-binding protein
VHLKVDIIVTTGGSLPALAVKKATLTLPIVFISGDPVRAGLVASLGRPGGNLTGVNLLTSELNVKRLDLLKEAIPGLARVAVLANPAVPTAGFFRQRDRIVGLATKHRLPAVFEWREFTEAGGILSYGTDIAAMYRRLAGYVDKILKGAKPGELPVEEPTKFELCLNLKTAKALGLAIAPSVLVRADKVIE